MTVFSPNQNNVSVIPSQISNRNFSRVDFYFITNRNGPTLKLVLTIDFYSCMGYVLIVQTHCKISGLTLAHLAKSANQVRSQPKTKHLILIIINVY